MILQQVLDILAVAGVPSSTVVLRKEGQIQICCPLAKWFHSKKTDSNPSMSIGYSDTRPTLFRCFACNESGKLWQLIDSIGTLSDRQDLIDLAAKLIEEDKPTLSMSIELACRNIRGWVKEPARRMKINIHPDAVNKRMLFVGDVPECRDTLIKRGVEPDVWRKFNLRYDYHNNRIVFPVYDRKDRLVGAVGRTMLDPVPENVAKYKNFFGFEATYSLGGINHVTEDSERILVAEGYFCVLHGYKWAKEHKSDVVCTFHGETSKEQADQLIELGKPLWYMYDNDKTGNDGWEKAQRLLYGRVPALKRIWMPPGWDLGRLDREQFLDCFMQAKRSLNRVVSMKFSA